MKRTYQCPTCGRTISLYVTPSEPPICTNPTIHKTRPTVMEEQCRTNTKTNHSANTPPTNS